jgi:hypothetical protein
MQHWLMSLAWETQVVLTSNDIQIHALEQAEVRWRKKLPSYDDEEEQAEEEQEGEEEEEFADEDVDQLLQLDVIRYDEEPLRGH